MAQKINIYSGSGLVGVLDASNGHVSEITDGKLRQVYEQSMNHGMRMYAGSEMQWKIFPYGPKTLGVFVSVLYENGFHVR